ncbi:MAG: LLM class flavin-dependent oxidoreductase [Actinomycetota bacterium]|nr:LLM class flavin-dependent oxidoreductase [Actinomycetota bacterium]
MRLGLALPHYDFSVPGGGPVSLQSVVDTARRAERLGYDSVWISDHFFLSLARYGGPGEPAGSAEPLTTLAALAAVTERVRLGTLVLGAGFRHPATLAKSAVTIDLASRGRLDLGLGAGWYEDEYRAFGYPFGSAGERFQLLEETVEVLALLFGEDEPVTWTGKHFALDRAYCHPRAAQEPRPPLLIGGKGGPRLLRLVARRADGWNTVWAWAPEDYAERARALDEACRREGRDPSEVRRSIGLYTVVGEDEADLRRRWGRVAAGAPGGLAGEDPHAWGRDKLVGTPEQILERLGEFARLGVDEAIVSIGPLPFAVADDEMVDLIAERVSAGAGDL